MIMAGYRKIMTGYRMIMKGICYWGRKMWKDGNTERRKDGKWTLSIFWVLIYKYGNETSIV